MVSPINSTVPSGPPTSATQRTRIRSRSENSIPMENMSRTTPISANDLEVARVGDGRARA